VIIARRLARPLLASIFIYGGIDAFRNPEAKAPAADPVVGGVPDHIPGIASTAQLVRLDAGAKIVGGLALATGKFPRLASLGLATSLTLTTLAGHRFWEIEDPAKRRAQQLHFVKNLSILGGVLLAALDTAGKPSIGWQLRRFSHEVGDDAVRAVSAVESAVGSVVESALSVAH
jgi:putative oxidoreductase